MKARRLVSLLLPLVALSGCSYRGDAKPLQDGDFLVRDSYVVRHDTFEELDRHAKANETFLVYMSLEGCSACESFEEGFREVVSENKLLTLHYEFIADKAEIDQMVVDYPNLKAQEAPALFLMEGPKITTFDYDSISSESRLRNALKKKVSLSNHYYFKNETNYQVALEKGEFDEATVIELNPTDHDQLTIYHQTLDSTESAVFIRHNTSLTSIQISKISK